MTDKMITVFTPTYNRAYKLSDLFKSLMEQTCFEFEWLIIDDGSTDSTKKLAKDFMDNGRFAVRYFYKENEGKQIAMNYAANLAETEWIFTVDSDDVLCQDAIEKVLQYCETIKSDNSFAGVAGLRGNQKGETWNTSNISHKRRESQSIRKQKYIDATAIEYRYGLKIQGDRAEVIRRDILRKYPFPKVQGERFIPESFLWLSVARDGYRFRWFNDVIYITEYLEDGLTKNGRELAKQNCEYRCIVDNLKTEIKTIPLRERFKSAINYYRYGRLSGKTVNKLYANSKSKGLDLLVIPIALIMPIK